MRSLLLSSFVLFIAGCGDDLGDSGQDAASGGPGGPQADGGVTWDTAYSSNADDVEASFVITSFPSDAPLAGARAEAGDATGSTDATGTVVLPIPTREGFAARFVYPDFHDTWQYGFNDDDSFTVRSYKVSRETTAAITSSVGVTLDPAQGIVVGVVFTVDDTGSLAYLPGASVSLDVPVEASMVPDATGSAGFSLGDTTRDDAQSWVIFLNVPAGEVTPTVTPPGDQVCTVFPGVEHSMTIASHPDGLSMITWVCV